MTSQVITAKSPRVEILEVPGPRLDGSAARSLVDKAAAMFAKQPDALVLDLSHVNFMDSLGVAALAAVHRRAPKSTKISLCGLQDYVQTVARITRLQEVFTIYTTASAALNALS